MKVFHKYGIAAFSGTIEQATFWPSKGKMASFLRQWVMPKHTTQNTDLGEIATNLAAVYGDISIDYKDDLKIYADRWNSQNYDPLDLHFQNRSSYSFFIKMMYLFSELDSEHVDLKTVTFSDLQTLGGDIATIDEAISNGYMESVTPHDDLTATM